MRFDFDIEADFDWCFDIVEVDSDTAEADFDIAGIAVGFGIHFGTDIEPGSDTVAVDIGIDFDYCHSLQSLKLLFDSKVLYTQLQYSFRIFFFLEYNMVNYILIQYTLLLNPPITARESTPNAHASYH